MVRDIPDILAQIVENKRKELEHARPGRAELERAAELAVRSRRDFRRALETRNPAIIAEVKKASPSRGTLSGDFQPAGIASNYEAGGAAALSVLTDRLYFHGKIEDLQAARAATRLPTLRKDFTIDELHVIEAAASGADAILLIAALLSEAEMRRFRELAANYSMAALVEVHDETELEPALGSGAEIVGVNNRNLHTFEVSLDVSLRLAERIPAGVLKISESGIRSAAHIRALGGAGYRGFLIGEHLMKAADPALALRELLADPRP